jgi:protein-S-isoprenylcysteine O-methyltransferase Ste14
VQAWRDPVLAACWAVFFTYWLVAALWTKRTAERDARWSVWRWAWLVVLLVLLLDLPAARVGRMWNETPAVRFMADALAVIGLAVALWARTVLARNWSANVVLKEQHELVETGPYRVVRHPIYTGVLLMVLGSVVSLGSPAGVLAFAACAIGLWMKAQREERLLSTHFPQAYPSYKSRVRAALVPFII